MSLFSYNLIKFIKIIKHMFYNRKYYLKVIYVNQIHYRIRYVKLIKTNLIGIKNL